MPRFAITGASGGIGGRVARRLAAAGIDQRLVVRDPARAPQLPGATVAVATYADGAALRRAVEGTDVVLLVSAGEDPDRVRLHLTAVEAIADAGVERIVYVSFLRCAPGSTFTFARDHWHTERAIEATGLARTFLRDSIYLDMLPRMVGTDGVIRGPGGNGGFAPVARDDVADVATAVLLDDGHAGRAYDVTGGERLTMQGAAEALTAVTGRPIAYVAETTEEAYASRAGYGAPDWEVAGWVTTYAAIATGELDVVSDTVAGVAGHPPVTLAGYLAAHPEDWRHLQP
ncbi:MAG: SDR family oxidoreductase [Frankiaceae bacterium]